MSDPKRPAMSRPAMSRVELEFDREIKQRARDIEELLAAAHRLGLEWVETPYGPRRMRYELAEWPEVRSKLISHGAPHDR